VSAGWSWVYGALAALAAVGLAWRNHFQAPSAGYWTALVTLSVTAVLLIFPVPWMMNRHARHITDERVRLALRSAAVEKRVERMIAAGLTYNYLVKPKKPEMQKLQLTAHANGLFNSVS
jgi:hypothetical protein